MPPAASHTVGTVINAVGKHRIVIGGIAYCSSVPATAIFPLFYLILKRETDIYYGNVPCDNTAANQVNTACDKCKCTCFTNTSAIISEEIIEKTRHLSFGKRCCACNSINR